MRSRSFKASSTSPLELFYESTPNVLSELIRTAFIPKEGCRFIVADFSAIEARVLAWLSDRKHTENESVRPVFLSFHGLPSWLLHLHPTKEVCRIMAEPPSWVHGLPLRADGYECQFYKKD